MTPDEQKVIDALKEGRVVLIEPKLLKQIMDKLIEMDERLKKLEKNII